MSSRRGLCPLFILLLIVCASVANGQADASIPGTEAFAGRWRDLALTTDCEKGFRRFMQMAQEGGLGDDVANANVGVFKNHARVELVRQDSPAIILFLTPRQSAVSGSQYFSIDAGPNATSHDVERVARALDRAFAADPFELAYDFFNASPGTDAIPSLGEAWAGDGWRGVARTLARRTASLASLTYTITVLVLVGMALAANVVVLWGAVPPQGR